MTVLRIKGLKRYRAKGRWYAYHRKTGIRLKAEFGTAGFIVELAEIERKLKTAEALPGTLGLLFSSYRGSPAYGDLAPATRQGYARMMNLLRPLDAMPLVELSSQFIAGLRDRVAAKHGRRQANYVMAVVSVACEHGREHGIVQDNPVTLLVEAGYDLDTVRRWLGQKTLAMAIHYSETADTSNRMRDVITKLDPLGSKART
jgi:hypothetical protein